MSLSSVGGFVFELLLLFPLKFTWYAVKDAVAGDV